MPLLRLRGDVLQRALQHRRLIGLAGLLALGLQTDFERPFELARGRKAVQGRAQGVEITGHGLQLLLADKNHIPHQPPVISERISVTVLP